jgi:hypothetical protein
MRLLEEEKRQTTNSSFDNSWIYSLQMEHIIITRISIFDEKAKSIGFTTAERMCGAEPNTIGERESDANQAGGKSFHYLFIRG